MSGLYIHIPFCKTRCIYCDFFSSTSMKEKSRYIDAICQELTLQKDYLQGTPVHTVYFGGGTPSQLNASDFEKIFNRINQIYGTTFEEVTLEANPDDISPEYLNALRRFPFNRISIGIQSFDDAELQFLNRRHGSEAAIRAVKQCQQAGFDNISIDLIYGLPRQTLETWKKNLNQAVDLNIQHISAYHLIYEENTKLHRLLKSGKISPTDEDTSVEMFGVMIDRLKEAGFEHYEISNFARKDCYSKHNSSYWNGTYYLGIGASAHSYNGKSRQWNISSLKQYIDSIDRGSIPAETEIINERRAYNDYIITRIRTSSGIDLDEMASLFGEKAIQDCLQQAEIHLSNKTLEQKNKHLKLTRKGIFISDSIMSDLIIV